MQTDGRRAKERPFSAFFRRRGIPLLASAYAVVLVLATHVPKPERLVGGHPFSDKLLHFAAYLLLAAFAASALRAVGRSSWRTAGVVAVALAVFAAIDEITQPFFGRNAELLDWVADCGGIAVGMAVVVALTSSGWGRGSR